ncbi:MAG: hypothetical protein QOG53_3216 [Frankiales bacterium]|nr:hypothetical protein [Frankiales bacterium]
MFCRCWWEGRTSEPPVALELVVFDPEEGHFDVPTLGIDDPLRFEFLKWEREGACEHEHMCLVSCRIGNVWSQGAFAAALRERPEDFPVLRAMVDGRANGGWTSPEDCALALDELALFRAVGGERGEYLVRDDTGESVGLDGPLAASYEQPEFLAIESGRLLVVRGGDALAQAINVGGIGRMIAGDAWRGTVVWSSSDFDYRPERALPPEAVPERFYIEGGLVERWSAEPDSSVLHELATFVDRPSGTSVTVTCCIPDVDETCHLFTVARTTAEEEHALAIDALTRLCNAAVLTNSPLYYW